MKLTSTLIQQMDRNFKLDLVKHMLYGTLNNYIFNFSIYTKDIQMLLQ